MSSRTKLIIAATVACLYLLAVMLAAGVVLGSGLEGDEQALFSAVLERRLATPLRADRIPRRAPERAAEWLAVAGAMAVLVLFCLAPIAAIVLRAALAGASAWAVLWEPDTLQALGNTLRFSGVALLLATALGLLHALAARHSAALRALAFLPLVVSPVLVAFGLLLLYPTWTASVPLLVAAYALLAYPLVKWC